MNQSLPAEEDSSTEGRGAAFFKSLNKTFAKWLYTYRGWVGAVALIGAVASILALALVLAGGQGGAAWPPIATPTGTAAPATTTPALTATSPATETPAATPTGHFTSPLDAASVPEVFPIAGSYANVGGDDCLWLAIQNPYSNDIFREIILELYPDGSFIGRAVIGSGASEDYGKTFLLKLMLVPKGTCEAWRNEPRVSPGFLPPIPQLPRGVVPLDHISVILSPPASATGPAGPLPQPTPAASFSKD